MDGGTDQEHVLFLHHIFDHGIDILLIQSGAQSVTESALIGYTEIHTVAFAELYESLVQQGSVCLYGILTSVLAEVFLLYGKGFRVEALRHQHGLTTVPYEPGETVGILDQFNGPFKSRYVHQGAVAPCGMITMSALDVAIERGLDYDSYELLHSRPLSTVQNGQ